MLVFLLTTVLALAPSQAAQNTAIIEGRVMRAGSQEPIPNVQITVIKSSAGESNLSARAASVMDSFLNLAISAATERISEAEMDSEIASREQALGLPPGTFGRAVRLTRTDATGRFSFNNQPTGKYTILTTHDGYYGLPGNTRLVTKYVAVEAPNPVPPTDIFMVKGGIIAGRVRDPNGQPASDITVLVTQFAYSSGRAQLIAVNSNTTDDRGEFRIFWVAPGEYYVDASPRVATAVPGRQDSWARTFFPGVADPTTATTLVVKDGAEIERIDFQIQPRASTSTFTISGKVSNPLTSSGPITGALAGVVPLTLLPREPGLLDSWTSPTMRSSTGQNGEFEFRNVRPGSYDLFAAYQPPRLQAPASPSGTSAASPAPLLLTRYYIDRARVDIHDSNVEGVQLQIQPGTEFRGKVVAQGSTSMTMDKIKIRLRQMDSMPEGFAVIVGEISVDSKGEFSAQNVPSARYTLRFPGLPETAYVADIRQGGTSVFDSGFTMGNQSGTSIEILVNPNGATIEGNVQTANKKPSASATVVLVPSENHRKNDLMYKTVQSDEKGSFVIKGVAPGEYTLFAWESVPNTAWMNLDFLAKYQDRGRAIVVSQGARMEVQLDLIPDEINRR